MAPIGTGKMADTTRFTLTLDEPGAGPGQVVGKFASADDQSRGTGLALRAYEIEVRFYREVVAGIGAACRRSIWRRWSPRRAGSRC